MDVFRVLLQYAQAMQSNRVDKVILAAFGQKKCGWPATIFKGWAASMQLKIRSILSVLFSIISRDGRLASLSGGRRRLAVCASEGTAGFQGVQ